MDEAFVASVSATAVDALSKASALAAAVLSAIFSSRLI